MKYRNRISILTGLIVLLAFQLQGQHFLSTNGQAIVNENQDTILLRGMGLGGWMVQEGYMLQTAGFANPQHEIRATIEALIGEADTELFYEAWLANHVRKADIDSLKAWGFNSVRLPMHYNLFTLPIEEEPVAGQQTWLTKGFELTDSLISWCKQNEMYVILDLHAAPGGQGYDQGISDYDPSKPSLWESQQNRDKMVALWGRLAERYADEQWVAGYDLLNEPNWDLPGNTALRNLYEEVTEAIRAVDSKHILFIEGNWFANDFTGLTPPWDDNMVYSPHKYWSFNDQASIQWVLDIREAHNVPLYLGESGENSNVWFRDAIRLLEDHDIGWAWWPMKKIESIAGPLSVVKTPEYQALLDFWSGNGPAPTVAFARAALMEIAEGLKVEDCVFQKDVIDAMFRQAYSDETIPFRAHNIPGVIHATDFDMGVIGEAYFDGQVATYHVSTGNYTAWNNGWVYRNDGVDIEPCTDDVNTNGYNVGWVDTGEWMQYEASTVESGVYEIRVRVASGDSGGELHFAVGEAALTPPFSTPPTGGWQEWETMIIPDVILDANDRKIRLYVDEEGFNISSFEFIKTSAAPSSVPTSFVAAVTLDETTIQMNANKLLSAPLPPAPGGFEILVNGASIPITGIQVDEANPRIIRFAVDHLLNSTQTIKMSYTGSEILASDGTALNPFSLEDVKNTLRFIHPVPGRIEAENYLFQSGVQLENTTDAGGGQNIAYLDPGDYLDYEINVASTGTYRVNYRIASQDAAGAIELQLIDDEDNPVLLHAPSFPRTDGWQSWVTVGSNVPLTAGIHKIRMVITQAPFNMNWFEFNLLPTSTGESGFLEPLKVFPNPNTGVFSIQGQLKEQQNMEIQLYNSLGQAVWQERLNGFSALDRTLDMRGLPNGSYVLCIRLENGEVFTERIVKQGGGY